VTLAATDGVLTLAGTSGLTVSGNGTRSDERSVGKANINTALAGLTFTPAADYNGAASLAVTTNDLGSTASGSPRTQTGSVAITVNAVNDAPVNSVPAAQTINEDTPLVFCTANGNAISVSDVDANGASEQVTLAATDGVLTLAGTSGLTVSGNGT